MELVYIKNFKKVAMVDIVGEQLNNVYKHFAYIFAEYFTAC